MCFDISNENDDDTHNLLDTFTALQLDQHVGLLKHKSGNILDIFSLKVFQT